jgi:hypothetical protein
MEELVSLLLQGLIEGVFGALIFVPIGFLYLYIRHRNGKKVQQVLTEEYANSYANAGQVVFLNLVAAAGIVLVLGLIVGAPLLHWFNSLK